MKYEAIKKILEAIGYEVEDGEDEFPEGIKYFHKVCEVKELCTCHADIQVTIAAIEDEYYEKNAPEIVDDTLMAVSNIGATDAGFIYSIGTMELLIDMIREADRELRDFGLPYEKGYSEYYCGYTYTNKQDKRRKLS